MNKFSQYPHEVEVTWPPLTALSFASKEVHGLSFASKVVHGPVVVLKVQPTICQKDGRRLYAEGGVTSAERTPEELVRPARLGPTNPDFPGEIKPAERVWESDAFGSKTHLSNAETRMDDRGGGLFVFMENQKPPCVERPSSAARRQASRANSLAQQQEQQQQRR